MLQYVHNWLLLFKIQAGSTALICAAGEGHTAIVVSLVEAGADINIRNEVRLYMYVSYHMKQICLYEISLYVICI